MAQKIKPIPHKTRVHKIVHPFTETLENSSDIAEAFKDYYQALYNLDKDVNTAQPTEELMDTFLQEVALPLLSEEQKKELSTSFTTLEIDTISSLPLHKSPG